MLAAALFARMSVVAAEVCGGLGGLAVLAALLVFRKSPSKNPLGRAGLLLLFLGFVLLMVRGG